MSRLTNNSYLSGQLNIYSASGKVYVQPENTVLVGEEQQRLDVLAAKQDVYAKLLHHIDNLTGLKNMHRQNVLVMIKIMDAQFCCVYLTVLVYVKHEYMIEHLNSLFAQFYPNSKVTYACMHGYLVCSVAAT